MNRREIAFSALQRMLPEQMDELPMPAEFRELIGKKRRVRFHWTGVRWVDLGTADGTEPLLVTDEGNTLATEEWT